jgi:hypothetical protein
MAQMVEFSWMVTWWIGRLWMVEHGFRMSDDHADMIGPHAFRFRKRRGGDPPNISSLPDPCWVPSSMQYLDSGRRFPRGYSYLVSLFSLYFFLRKWDGCAGLPITRRPPPNDPAFVGSPFPYSTSIKDYAFLEVTLCHFFSLFFLFFGKWDGCVGLSTQFPDLFLLTHVFGSPLPHSLYHPSTQDVALQEGWFTYCFLLTPRSSFPSWETNGV